MRTHIFRRALAVSLAASLLLAACGDDDDSVATDTTATTTTEATPTSEETTTTELDGGDDAAGTVIEVEVAGGRVEGGGRHKVSTGDTVTIRVTSDVADEIHLHGYDIFADVAAGETADLTFEASIRGVFEVELESSHLPLLELEVS